mgnify:CR=1 FL=1
MESSSRIENLMQNKRYDQWTTDDALVWLEDYLKLPQYKSNFIDLALDGTMFDFITDTDLENDLNIKVRLHRIKITEGIKRLK